MATYAIGDIHGCEESLRALVKKINPSPKDTLWFCGDIVNRGPSSLDCIRFIKSLKNKIVCVLGNHDIYLLAIASGVIKPPKNNESLNQVLNSKDNDEIINWLRFLPLMHIENKTILVHAGLLPNWEPIQIYKLANKISSNLKSHYWKEFLFELWGNSPGLWTNKLKGAQRNTLVVNGLTRIRFLKSNGEMDFTNKLSPKENKMNLFPWFLFPNRLSKDYKVIFGHWSSLGLIIRPNLISLDTGCVWGGMLTAVRVEDNKIYSQKAID